MRGPIWTVWALIGWLGIIVALVGCIACIRNLGRSRWVPVLLGGFALHVVLGVLERLSGLMIGEGVPASSIIVCLAFAAASGLGVLADGAVVCGVAGLLHDLGLHVSTPPVAQQTTDAE